MHILNNRFRDSHVCAVDFFYPRDALHGALFAVVRRLSILPSICVSVTRRYCV